MLQRSERIVYKTDRELERIRVAGRMVAEVHALMKSMVKPGVTTGDLNEAAHAKMKELGGDALATIVCSEAPACKTYADEFKNAAEEFPDELDNAEVVYQATASSSQPNYTAECLAARDAGASSHRRWRCHG